MKFELARIMARGLSIPVLGWRRRLLGLDVGHRFIKAVELSRRGPKTVLEKYVFTDLANVFQNFPRERDPDQVLKALAEIHQLRGVRTAMALPDDEVLRFDLTLPVLPRSELGVAVEYEVSNLSRIPEAELSVDYWQESIDGRMDGATQKIKAFAARRSAVDRMIDMVDQAGFKPNSIESRMLANVEALRFNDYIHSRSQSAVIDLGDSHSTIGFIRDGVLHSCRTEKVGSCAMNEILSRQFGINLSSAEKIKKAFSVGGSGSSTPEEEALEDIYLRIFKTIKDSIEGYLENQVGARIEELLLVGGGSGANGLDEALSTFFKVPAIRANPFKNIQIYTEKTAAEDNQIGSIASQMTTAVGLALRNIK